MIDEALKYSDESVKECREMLSILKKRQTLELEYAKGLLKLCQMRVRPNIDEFSPDIKTRVLSNVLWTAFDNLMEKSLIIAESHVRVIGSSNRNKWPWLYK
jgi:hypothetical protein